jgi:cytochrome bd ubiquinol oxidase subunit II
MSHSDLAFIWAGLIAFAVFAYVVMDGFDLGVGILFPAFKREEERSVMMNSIAPVWDGNETWLVLGGGGLLAVFPLAYAVIMPALYAPIIAMLLALIFRGVAFEFRWRTERAKYLWDWGFAGGSMFAAFAQGVTLGALVQGIRVENRAYAGGWWDWLTPFSLLTGVALVIGYALLGSTWLVMKTTGDLRERAKKFALVSGAATMVMIAVVSLWTPFLNPEFLDRWFGQRTIWLSALMPLLLGLASYVFYRGLSNDRDAQPFIAALAIFFLCYVGVGISFYPMIAPPSISIWDAAAPASSLAFLLVGAVVLVPMILLYTGYAYWVFRGKVDPNEGYH